MKPYLLLFLFSNLNAAAQTNQYQNLIDTAIGRTSLFVFSKPISQISLEKNEIWMYAENLKERSNQILDTVIFLQIIENARRPDTTLWKETEFQFSLLINSKDEIVSKKYAALKLSFADKKQIRLYNKQINYYNASEPYNRNIQHFSRPVFDNSNTFAIIQWYNAHGGLGGGGGINLYKLDGAIWKYIGIIISWKY
jgi:hypothetical protein